MTTDKKEFNILIIEDNPGDFVLVEDFLVEQIEVVTLMQAIDFKEAQEILSAGIFKFDVILLDLSLPDKSGLPLIREIVELSLNTPVIVLTGYADSAFGVKSLSLGIADYILKEELTASSLYKSIVYSSERKKAISAIEESEKKYSELFHLSPLPMFVFELETLIFLDVNEAFIRHYGYTREMLLMMNLKEIRSQEEIPAFEMALLKFNKDPINNSLGIFKHLKKNGEVISVEIQSNFINYKGINARVSIATDITERLNYIKEIEEQNRKLSEISWIQSHIVRAPLARIMGLVNIIKDLKDEDEKRRMFEYLLLSADELDKVIREITDKTIVAEDEISFTNVS
ncbi:MAG: domain S-box protein [Mucilaginibacter sp.]|nr:domain S-box protein [Mucilaginibacter sp.]